MALELDPALTRAGCERILEDRQSGAKADRPGLRDALDYARDGDTLTVWRLDRLRRSLKDLIDLVSQLEARGIGLKSLHESIDTTSSSGKLIFHAKRNILFKCPRWSMMCFPRLRLGTRKCVEATRLEEPISRFALPEDRASQGLEERD